MSSKIHIGCNYHTTWQSNPAMRFVLMAVNGDKATLTTRGTKKTFETNVSDLIFIESPHNIAKSKKVNKEFISIEVSVPPWSESEKSWYVLTKKGHTAGSWSTGKWFPKKLCKLDLKTGVLTLPVWLHNKIFE